MRPPIANQPILNIPSPVGSLIGFTILVHVALTFLSGGAARLIINKLIFYPAWVMSDGAFSSDPIAFLLAPIGYVLLHADWMHLLMNMAWLLAFGSGSPPNVTGLVPWVLWSRGTGRINDDAADPWQQRGADNRCIGCDCSRFRCPGLDITVATA